MLFKFQARIESLSAWESTKSSIDRHLYSELLQPHQPLLFFSCMLLTHHQKFSTSKGGESPHVPKYLVNLTLESIKEDHKQTACFLWVSGTCHDNAVTECAFQLLKQEWIKRKPITIEKKPVARSLIRSRCSTTPNGMAPKINYRRVALR